MATLNLTNDGGEISLYNDDETLQLYGGEIFDGPYLTNESGLRILTDVDDNWLRYAYNITFTPIIDNIHIISQNPIINLSSIIIPNSTPSKIIVENSPTSIYAQSTINSTSFDELVIVENNPEILFVISVSFDELQYTISSNHKILENCIVHSNNSQSTKTISETNSTSISFSEKIFSISQENYTILVECDPVLMISDINIINKPFPKFFETIAHIKDRIFRYTFLSRKYK